MTCEGCITGLSLLATDGDWVLIGIQPGGYPPQILGRQDTTDYPFSVVRVNVHHHLGPLSLHKKTYPHSFCTPRE